MQEDDLAGLKKHFYSPAYVIHVVKKSDWGRVKILMQSFWSLVVFNERFKAVYLPYS